MRLFLILVLVVWSSWAQSQPVSNVDNGQPKTQQTETKKNTPEKSIQKTVSTTKEIVKTNAGPKDNEHQQSRIARIFDGLKSWFDKFLDDPIATFTGLLFVATFFLWLATRRLVKGAEETAERQLRAYVFPVGIFSRWVPNQETNSYGWRIQPQWQNSGATPSKNLIIHAGGELRDTILPEDFNFNYPTNNIGHGLIPPRLTLLGGVVPQNPISPQDLVEMQAGKKFFYIWGWARYNDVFPGTPQHITRFCWIVDVVGNPLTFKPASTNPAEQLTFGYIYHPNGNCADEECDQQHT